MRRCAARARRVVAAAAAAGLMAGCAGPNPRDPLESYNRAMFAFNDRLDRAVLRPVAEGYKAVLPEFVRTGVTNFFSNLGDVWIGINNFLQGKVEEGLSDTFRVAINTTFGLGGLLDVASEMRLEKHNEDFGQTLAVWGVGSGPYIVLPIFGPSTLRDTGGFGVDYWYGYAPTYVLKDVNPPHRVTWRNGIATLEFINVRANLLGATNVLEQAALDKYAFTRDFWLRRRRSLIYDGSPPPEKEPEEEEEDTAPPPGGRSSNDAIPSIAVAASSSATSSSIVADSVPRAAIIDPSDFNSQDLQP